LKWTLKPKLDKWNAVNACLLIKKV
jgi:hypothetical protein